MDSNGLMQFAGAVASGAVRVVDLTFTLSPDFPVIVLPPEFGQAAPVRIETISRYDDAGPGWYWNNISFGEHTGTHFDAPIHWVTGKDYPDNATHNIPVERFIGPACVIDVSPQVRSSADFLLTQSIVEQWESRHGRIGSGSHFAQRLGSSAAYPVIDVSRGLDQSRDRCGRRRSDVTQQLGGLGLHQVVRTAQAVEQTGHSLGRHGADLLNGLGRGLPHIFFRIL